jgi:ElaB/YqjD/DUF883 family membrane-anchored ribosome-binding protein
MADLNWKERIAGAQSSVDALSASARETAAAARARVGASYGEARERMAGLAHDGRAIASSSAEISGRAVATGRKAMDKALVQSRDLIAERPITAVVIGLTAGVVLGYLANRLAKSRRTETQTDDEFIGG